MVFERQIERIVLTGGGPEGRTYAIVEFREGGFGISRDGAPLAPHYWPEADIDRCAEHFIRLIDDGSYRAGNPGTCAQDHNDPTNYN